MTEDEIAEAKADFARHVKCVNRSTDDDSREAMNEILLRQSKVNTLRPARSKDFQQKESNNADC